MWKLGPPKVKTNLAPQNYVQHQENVSAPQKLFDTGYCLDHVSFNLVHLNSIYLVELMSWLLLKSDSIWSWEIECGLAQP